MLTWQVLGVKGLVLAGRSKEGCLVLEGYASPSVLSPVENLVN